ncbi:MAG: hypothetical protein ACE5OQ_04545 [Woeseia sp.]
MAEISARIVIGCLVAVGSLAGAANAQTLEMEGTVNADQTAYEESGRPTRGMTQARVEALYGAPQNIEAAVGDPPISRWHYEKFVVYFEYDRVIHAVLKR